MKMDGSWWRRWWAKCRRRLDRSKTERRLVEECRVHDSTENAETAPPVEERIDLACMWGVEIYTPAHVDLLLFNLKKLGWDSQEGDPGMDAPGAWISRSRQHPFSGSWLNLGVIHPKKDDTAAPFNERTALLPENVQYATVGSTLLLHLCTALSSGSFLKVNAVPIR